MRTRFCKRSAPTLAANQRRRQIIDLLADHGLSDIGDIRRLNE